jgi:Asp-tRNA(Asn)/Glu-tRNA(Gln) amidotransferase A subunit family amidase
VDFRDVTIEELVSAVRARRTSARELAEAAIANIERLNPVLNAFCAVDRAAAFADADAIDARLRRGDPVGPLAGIPLGVKDLEEARGYVTTFGSDLHKADAPATYDSVLVARLKAAGCVVVGKTNTPEFGHKAVTDNVPFGFTRNPWNLEHTAGGSSGGSSAALASGMVPLATGSDGGGSIRIPASLCGFTGFKASQGRIPLGGSKPPGASVLAVRGPMTLRARDLAVTLDAVVGDESTDPYALEHPGYSFRAALDGANQPPAVVWSPTMGFAEVDAEVRSACEAFVARLAGSGVTVIERERIWDRDPNGRWFVLWATLRARAQGDLLGTPSWERIDETLRATIEYGLGVSGIEYARAMDACHELNLGLEAAFAQAPFVLTPTCSGQVPREGATGGVVNGLDSPAWVSFTAAINMTRNPAGTVCVGRTAAGLPIGLQVIGRQRDDLGVLKTLCFFEDLAAVKHDAPHGIEG